MGTSALDPRTSSPRRLLRREGQWELEVEHLVTLDRAILRPEIAVVSGEDRILAHLDAPGTRALAHAASQLMRTSGPSTDDRAFEPASSGWVATGLAAVRPAEPRIAPEAPEIHALLASARRKMSRELSQLAEAHAAVLRQVDALSARVKALEASGACPADACAARAPGVAEGRELAEAEKVRQADEVPGPHGGLRLPDAAELAVVLETALKNGITVRAADPDRAPCLDDLSAFHGSPLLDDAGDVVGLVLGDPGTVVRLGGALMGLDDSRLQEELVAETLSEDLVACASELFATLATVIDGVRGNVHVRAGFLEALSPDAHPWTASPASRLDLEDSRGARLVILAR